MTWGCRRPYTAHPNAGIAETAVNRAIGQEGIRIPGAPPGLLLWIETVSSLQFCGDVAVVAVEGHTVVSVHNTCFQVAFQVI